MPISSAVAFDYFEKAAYRLLDISPAHATAVEALPARHVDPFDRILVAQAITEPLRLITHDPKVAHYSNAFVEM